MHNRIFGFQGLGGFCGPCGLCALLLAAVLAPRALSAQAQKPGVSKASAPVDLPGVWRRVAELAPQVAIVRARLRHQLPELRRVIEALEVHQLVNEDVVAYRRGHLHETPVETDVA